MSSSATDILVPVGKSETFRNTVAYAVREAQKAAKAGAEKPTVHFVHPIRWRPIEGVAVVSGDSEELFERVRLWAREDLDGGDVSARDLPIDIVTEQIGQERYLFSPADYVEVIYEYATAHDIDRVILDPEYKPTGSAPLMSPLLDGLEAANLDVEEAPVERVTRRTPVSSRTTLAKVGLVFAVSYAFYLVVGGTLDAFNLVTGALVAGLTTAIFAAIAVETRPEFGTLASQVARLLVYFPYLLWEIAKANVTVAYIILHPNLPIDPAMRRFEGAVWGEYSVTTLANSITLTPGTLTVDVYRDSFYIHTLTQDARDDLEGGSLERAVRFVFYGRHSMDIPSPGERGAVTIPGSVSLRRSGREGIGRFDDGSVAVTDRPSGGTEE